jgi:hypothetical protein
MYIAFPIRKWPQSTSRELKGLSSSTGLTAPATLFGKDLLDLGSFNRFVLPWRKPLCHFFTVGRAGASGYRLKFVVDRHGFQPFECEESRSTSRRSIQVMCVAIQCLRRCLSKRRGIERAQSSVQRIGGGILRSSTATS